MQNKHVNTWLIRNGQQKVKPAYIQGELVNSIELFNLSLIRVIEQLGGAYIHNRLKPDVDAQNSVILELETSIIVWKFTANLDTKLFDVQEMTFDKEYKLLVDNYNQYDTLQPVLEEIVTLLNETGIKP